MQGGWSCFELLHYSARSLFMVHDTYSRFSSCSIRCLNLGYTSCTRYQNVRYLKFLVRTRNEFNMRCFEPSKVFTLLQYWSTIAPPWAGNHAGYSFSDCKCIREIIRDIPLQQSEIKPDDHIPGQQRKSFMIYLIIWLMRETSEKR